MAQSDQRATHPTWSAWLKENGFAALFGITEKAHPFDALEWSPSAKDRTAAWRLLVQLRTRIVTEGLAFRAGDEAAALQSVHSLFDIVRAILVENEGCTHFATLTITVLNQRIRLSRLSGINGRSAGFLAAPTDASRFAKNWMNCESLYGPFPG